MIKMSEAEYDSQQDYVMSLEECLYDILSTSSEEDLAAKLGGQRSHEIFKLREPLLMNGPRKYFNAQ